jgi:steroid delta-isomerase-like uncharacterized protein
MAHNQQNVNVVRKLYEDVFNKNNLNLLEEIFSPNVIMHDSAIPNRKSGIQSVKQTEQNYQRAFPDKKTKIEDIFGTDEQVTVRWTCTGTHKGELQGISPTNKNFEIMGISIYRLSNGKITEAWQSWDRLGLLEQIGEIEPALALHG